jgi:glyoxylase-like metal-dependent hydrolase (beta-lactamase superfamily II)
VSPKLKPRDLGGGVWHWTLPHPEWRPTTQLVGCYAVHTGGGTVLIDPLFDDPEPLDELIAGDVTVAITIPYHVRSAAKAAQRWNARIVGHPDVARRLPGLPVQDGAPGVRAHPIPGHKERVIEVGDALAFGDRVIGAEGGLRIWGQSGISEAYRARLNRWLEPLLELDFERVLTTHGEPVLRDGRAALRTALSAEPFAAPPHV